MFYIHVKKGEQVETWFESSRKDRAPEDCRWVPNWSLVPEDILISGVEITDGLHIREGLFGFDRYVVCQEASVGLSLVASTAGEVTPTAMNEPKVLAQHLYGIRDTHHIRQHIELTATAIRDEIQRSFEPDLQAVGGNVIRVKAYSDQIAGVTNRVEKLLMDLEAREVERVSIRVDRGFLKRWELNQAPEFFRKGIPELNGFSAEGLRQKLYPLEVADGR